MHVHYKKHFDTRKRRLHTKNNNINRRRKNVQVNLYLAVDTQSKRNNIRHENFLLKINESKQYKCLN